MARVVKCLRIGLESATFVANSHPELGLKSERLPPMLLCLDKPTNCSHTVPKVGKDLAAAQLIQFAERGMTDTLPEIEDLFAERWLFPIPKIRRLMSLKDGPRIRTEIFQKGCVRFREVGCFQQVRQL